MPFGMLTQSGPRNHVLDGRFRSSKGKSLYFLGGEWWPIVKYRELYVTCAKSAEPIEMLFGTQTQAGPRNHVLDGGRDSSREGALLRSVGPVRKYCRSYLYKNGWTLKFTQYVNGKLLPSVVYRCSPLGGWHFHIWEISNLTVFFQNTQQNSLRHCKWVSTHWLFNLVWRINQWKRILKNSTHSNSNAWIV